MVPEVNNDLAEYVLRFINQTDKNIFLTGKAGTGKTTLLKEILRSTHKNTVVVAPTGIAALNAGGITIHSLFQLPFASFIPDFDYAWANSGRIKFEDRTSLKRHFSMRGEKLNIIRNLELMIIDEVSMLRADVLDAIDYQLRTIRKDSRPFGSVQVLFIGDLLQLPPVVKSEEWDILRNFYQGMFFFHALVLKESSLVYVELEKIYRQQDDVFIDILNSLRENFVTQKHVEILNKYVNPEFDTKSNKGYIILTTHNENADQINKDSLREIDEKEYHFQAIIDGDFPEKIYPIDKKMTLKIGAQVMFTKNDLAINKRYFNGKIGVVSSISNAGIKVKCLDDQQEIEVEMHEWKNIHYQVDSNTKEINENVIGIFKHYPLKLAWAITVHKSQGLTFEKAVLDISKVFAPGQAYVALSRLTSLDGLILLKPIQLNGLSNDKSVVEFAQNKTPKKILNEILSESTIHYLASSLMKSFSWQHLHFLWQAHIRTYSAQATKSKKSLFMEWADESAKSFENLYQLGDKFVAQLHRAFQDNSMDLDYIKERTQKAEEYFFPLLDVLYESVLLVLLKVKRMKKMNAYLEEIQQLEEELLKIILLIKKNMKILELIEKGIVLDKFSLSSDFAFHYRMGKINQLNKRIDQESSNMNNMEFVEEEEDEWEEDEIKIIQSFKKSKPKKANKKSTYLQTFEMYQNKQTVAEIAQNRNLSISTINDHFVKLIQDKYIELSDIMEKNKIYSLEELYINTLKGLSLKEIKEIVGEEYSYHELKCFLAYIHIDA
ncbi:MAG: helix-turn-helix domain-containing protein [Chitinophagales bacterium]|nr:helix-turn-helix domain-containing protein [Chitinophagales bacterium]MCZ2394850.1 helix-turn-helix domain-containing protein [Chitinophagales bacterium]